MISVAIIGVLASMAGPTFLHYRFRSRTTEVRVLVSAIRSSQESFYASRDNYGDIAVAHPAGVVGTVRLTWQPAVPCPATCVNTPADCTSFECIGFASATDTYYQYNSPAYLIPGSPSGSAEYAIGAQGDVDGNGAAGGFAFQTDNLGAGGGQIIDGITACPLGLPAGQLFECVPGEW